VNEFLHKLCNDGHDTKEIGFTGGEPFMNPEIIPMTQSCLQEGYQVLILTNAMRPMMRPRVQKALLELQNSFNDQLTLRISLDHWSQVIHDKERGKGSYDQTLKGMRWLSENRFNMTIAGRALKAEKGKEFRQGYAKLFTKQGFDIDAFNPSKTVLFPEMDESADVPEITTACWSILNKNPKTMMCSSSRMIVKRKGDTTPRVIACTLLPYEPEFELGETLQDASKPVFLNHPHCAKFCVLGGATCSA
jgi:sulfatase maturation enzyme AslB (radical SAM superfamily)